MRLARALSSFTLFACLLAYSPLAQATDYYLDHMKANKILILGNSITLHAPRNDSGVVWLNNWGMAASSAAKDYVHLLAGKIDAATHGSLRIDPTDAPAVIGDPVIVGDANVVNIADIFEWNYATYEASKLQQQIDWQADIVVLQFGENINTTTFDSVSFKTNLQELVTDLKNSSNPNIFVIGYILGANLAVDAIKQEICAEDPTHRVFVDMSTSTILHGGYGHPNDAGMATISNTLYAAMEAHAAAIPEPGSMAMVFIAGACFGGRAWHRWRVRARTVRAATSLRVR